MFLGFPYSSYWDSCSYGLCPAGILCFPLRWSRYLSGMGGGRWRIGVRTLQCVDLVLGLYVLSNGSLPECSLPRCCLPNKACPLRSEACSIRCLWVFPQFSSPLFYSMGILPPLSHWGGSCWETPCFLFPLWWFKTHQAFVCGLGCISVAHLRASSWAAGCIIGCFQQFSPVCVVPDSLQKTPRGFCHLIWWFFFSSVCSACSCPKIVYILSYPAFPKRSSLVWLNLSIWYRQDQTDFLSTELRWWKEAVFIYWESIASYFLIIFLSGQNCIFYIKSVSEIPVNLLSEPVCIAWYCWITYADSKELIVNQLSKRLRVKLGEYIWTLL